MRALSEEHAIVRVGEGRGFLVRSRRFGSAIVTAAHCLPLDDDGRLLLPPAHPMSHTEERTYPRLVGALGDEPTITVECGFVDPIHDVAVLFGPDNQALSTEADAYETFVQARPALRLGRFAPTAGRVYTLDGQWMPCELRPLIDGSQVLFVEPGTLLRGGMSGSPILDATGRAVGVLSCAADNEGPHMGGPNPILALVLPVWLSVDLRLSRRRPGAQA